LAARGLQAGTAAPVCLRTHGCGTVAAPAPLVKPAQPQFKRENSAPADCYAALNQNAVPSFNFLSTALRKWPLVRL